jgi:hypothetical protein
MPPLVVIILKNAADQELEGSVMNWASRHTPPQLHALRLALAAREAHAVMAGFGWIHIEAIIT